MFTQLCISHQNPGITCSHCSLLSQSWLTPLKCGRDFLGRAVVRFKVDCPLLSSVGSLFLPLGSPRTRPPPPPRLSPCSSPPSPALASNGLNRLASCQSRGLLWLCHKSARKNRNHLFRPGPERGWVCKYMSLALALSPAWAHRTTEPTPTQPQPALPHSHIYNILHKGFS